MSSLRERVGVALQDQRQARGLSQSDLARLAKLSLKYVGEIVRGEANASMEVLERVTGALQWDPFETPLREQDILHEVVRTPWVVEQKHNTQHLAQTAPIRRRGRPRRRREHDVGGTSDASMESDRGH